MYLGKTTTKQSTYTRPQVQKVTAPLPQSGHVLEGIISKPSVRRALLWMTKRDSSGECFFEKLCRNYDNAEGDLLHRLRWAVELHLVVSVGR